MQMKPLKSYSKPLTNRADDVDFTNKNNKLENIGI